MLYQKLVERHLNKDERNKAVLSDGKICLTYEQIHFFVRRMVADLQAQGRKKGDRIVIMNHNSLETAQMLLACLAGGYVFVVVQEGIRGEELEKVIRDCGASLVLERLFTDGQEDASVWMRELCGEEDLCYILYTSGSSGRSKGILARQKQVDFCIEAIGERLAYGQKDRVLCCLPLAFDYGLYQLFLSLQSASLLFLAPGNPLQKIPAWLSLHKITIFPSLATVINLLLSSGLLKKEHVKSLRMVTFTGEELPVQLLRELEGLKQDLEMVPMYGLSECKRVSILPSNRKDKMWEGSCGLPLRGVHVFLKDKNPETGVGELVVEGPNVMEGYWGDSEETNRVFGWDRTTGRRYVRTGDLFRIDEEGFLFFCGRKNRMIKTMGIRFFPQELERKISQIPELVECRVTGIPHKIYGEQICICVYPASQTVLSRVKEAADSLPVYLQVYRIWPWSQPLPKNRNGKIDENEIRRIAAHDTSILGV